MRGFELTLWTVCSGFPSHSVKFVGSWKLIFCPFCPVAGCLDPRWIVSGWTVLHWWFGWSLSWADCWVPSCWTRAKCPRTGPGAVPWHPCAPRSVHWAGYCQDARSWVCDRWTHWRGYCLESSRVWFHWKVCVCRFQKGPNWKVFFEFHCLKFRFRLRVWDVFCLFRSWCFQLRCWGINHCWAWFCCSWIGGTRCSIWGGLWFGVKKIFFFPGTTRSSRWARSSNASCIQNECWNWPVARGCAGFALGLECWGYRCEEWLTVFHFKRWILKPWRKYSRWALWWGSTFTIRSSLSPVFW